MSFGRWPRHWRAQLTGAALIPAVTAHVDERRAMARARAIHEARTLSVRLVVPLALLILPALCSSRLDRR